MSVIRLHADDSVVIARTTLMPGFELAPGVPALERIPAGHKAAVRPLQVGEAAILLRSLPPPDVVYLDPMYPHRTKSALPKKEMRLFRLLVGPDDDAAALLAAARAVALRRVVVKRPAGAPFLGAAKPDGRVESKNTRYDLYLAPPL